MSISSVSGSSNNYGFTTSSTSSAETSNLEKQLAKYQQELRSLASSDEDEKTKNTKTQQLQVQIQQLQAEIAQAKNESSGSSTNQTQPSSQLGINQAQTDGGIDIYI